MNYRNTFYNQQKIIQQRFKDQCVIAQGGGLFFITPDFLASLKDIKEESQWALDMNSNPILIQNVANFYDRAYNVYYTALADFGTSYNQLKSQRSVESILEL
jgi:hypothetical protein